MRSYLDKVLAIIAKDVAVELRSKETIASTFVFAVMAMIVFNFAFELKVDNVEAIAPGVLWVTILFAGMLSLNRSFIVEKDLGCMDGLLLCPVDRSAIYLGKMVSNLIFILAVVAVVLPIFAGFFNLAILNVDVLVIILLGAAGFSAVGTLFSAVAVYTKTREVMLPILLLPVAIPLLVAAVKATGDTISGTPPTGGGPWLAIIVGFDAIFFVVAVLIFEHIFQE